MRSRTEKSATPSYLLTERRRLEHSHSTPAITLRSLSRKNNMDIIATLTNLIINDADGATILDTFDQLRADGCDDLTIAGALDIIQNTLNINLNIN